jgi:hypothetical protein
VDSSIDRQHAVERLFGPLPPEVKGVFVRHENDSFGMIPSARL